MRFSVNKARMLFLTTRPWSFSMTAISVLLGPVLAVSLGLLSWPSWNWLYALLTLAGMILVHGATNAINDYFDVKHKVDTPETATAQYREHFIITGKLKPQEVLGFSILLYGIAAVIGVVLAVFRGWPIVLFAVIGGLTSFFYTGGPVKFKHLALGEAAVFLMWGPVMVLASFFIQTGSFDRAGAVLLISIPQGLWVLLVLFANNMKDTKHDSETGVKTVANLLSLRASFVLFIVILFFIYAVTGVEIIAGLLPVTAVAVLVSFPFAIPLVRSLTRENQVPPDADPKTARVGMIFGVALILSLIVSTVFLEG